MLFGFVFLAALAAVYSLYSVWVLPTDANIIKQFQAHRAAADELVLQLKNDPDVLWVPKSVFARDNPIKKDRVKHLMRELGVKAVSRYGNETFNLVIYDFGGVRKDLVYIKNGRDSLKRLKLTVVDGLDDLDALKRQRGNLLSGSVFFRELEPDWYIEVIFD